MGWVLVNKKDYTEYGSAFLAYIRQHQMHSFIPRQNYMDAQPELTWEMHGDLNDSLLETHHTFELHQEMWFLCKMEETWTPPPGVLLAFTQRAYSPDHLKLAEAHILQKLEWHLGFPSPTTFLAYISGHDAQLPIYGHVATYLIEMQGFEPQLVSTSPSLLAETAIWLARTICELKGWSAHLRDRVVHSQQEIICTANAMLNYSNGCAYHSRFFNKYASMHFRNASGFVQLWVMSSPRAEWARTTKFCREARSQRDASRIMCAN
ncbi:hypothetical protein C8Q78DRAFT_993562 [Trametes maxima]|nr:hypothetical protein C8Q78DRAFT_993562 [Trametes maxima]